MKHLKNSRTLVALALALGLIVGLLAGVRLSDVHKAAAQAPDAAPLSIPDPVQLSTTFTKLAKQLEPSVVQVTSTIEPKQERRNRRGLAPQDPDDLFRRFFGQNPFEDMPMPQRPFRSQGTGSGFVVSDKGYILTNNHVVADATKIQVKLHGDRTDYTAKVIGSDPELDLAVIKIDAGRPLQSVKIGNSDGVQVGDWAVAIGSPFGLEATVTAGIISGLSRDLRVEHHQLQRFMQTDAAINPGNSGGPLLNMRGEVVGVNTMIATNSGANEGVGFALPINMAVNAYNQIVKTGKVSRGAIGIRFAPDAKPELLRAYGADSGVFVQDVTPGQPAEKAGLKEGDIVTSFNGKPVKDGEDLVAMVSQTPVGTRVPVTVLRDKKPMSFDVTVGDRAPMIAGDSGQGGPGEGGDRGEGQQAAKFGISVRSLSAQERDSLDFDAKSGVLVTEVDPNSFAEDVGLAPGDVVMEINRQPVSSVNDVKRIAGEIRPGDAVAFKAMRADRRPGGNSRRWASVFLAGTLPNTK
jgi:serine protease Do